jgi:prolyl-tRNA synthetase
VLVPIYSKDNNKEVDSKLKPLFETLKQKYRCTYDDSSKRPGDKYYHWEMKGVPLRIEAGMRDLSEGKVTIVDRAGNKQVIAVNKIEESIPKIVDTYHAQLYEQAQKFFNEHIPEAAEYDDLKRVFDGKKGLVLAGWCGSMECVEKLKAETISILGTEKGVKKACNCVMCGRKGQQVVLSKPY